MHSRPFEQWKALILSLRFDTCPYGCRMISVHLLVWPLQQWSIGPLKRMARMVTFSDFDRPASNLSLERWVKALVVSWGQWADSCSLWWFTDDVFVLLFCRSLTETMSELNCSAGKWKAYGKDLEMALQSQEARSCSEWGFLLRRLSGHLSPLFDRLYLSNNQLSLVPDSIGQLTNLTEYVIQFVISFQFSSIFSLIGFGSTTTCWAAYRTSSAWWPIWLGTAFNLLFVISILIALFDRLDLEANYLTSVPESFGQLTNLTVYGIQFVIRFQFSWLSLIGCILTAISWRPYKSQLA